MGTAFLLCESTHGREDGPPRGKITLNTYTWRLLDFSIAYYFFLLVYKRSGSHLDKSGAACLTLVWLLSRVDAGMGLEVGWSVELSTADVAAVRLCTCKFRSVSCEINKSVTSTKSV